MRLIPFLAAAILVVLTACGGSPKGSTGGPAVASCGAINDIAAYRYTIRVKFKSPAFRPTTNEGGIVSQINQLLTRLFENAELDGAFIAPDRSSVVLKTKNEELEVRTIGDRSWLRIGSLWQEQASPGNDVVLSPRSICDNIAGGLAPALEGIEPQEETVNGIESRRYHLDKANLEDLVTLFPAAAGEVPQQFSGDVWLAKDGNWPVRLRLMAATTDEQGKPVSLEMFMEFRDINDPDIEIEPPPLPPART